MSKKTTEQEAATPEQKTEIRLLVNELQEKSFSAGYAEGKEQGYAEGYSDGFDEGQQTGAPTPAAQDKDHGSELGDYDQVVEDDSGQVVDDFSMAEVNYCEYEEKINEVISSVRALLLNGADDVHIEHTVHGDFNISSERTV